MTRALVLLSGGIDSAASLHWACQTYQEVGALSYLYDRRPLREILATRRLMEFYPAKLYEIPLPFLKEFRKADLPEGYIPNRNMIFYAIAAYYADTADATILVGGHTAEDENPFPDAGLSFLEALQNLINTALLTRSIQIELPLGHLTKLQVLEKAIEWKIPLEHTWSCYHDEREPCGKCVSCLERSEAFQKLGIVDPLLNV